MMGRTLAIPIYKALLCFVTGLLGPKGERNLLPVHTFVVVDRFQKHVDGSAMLPSDLKCAIFTMAMPNVDESII